MKILFILALVMLTGCALSEEEAHTIAAEYVGGEEYLGNGYYNENSKTWWFDVSYRKEGCAPACVVYQNRTAEINWRCTGFLPENSSY